MGKRVGKSGRFWAASKQFLALCCALLCSLPAPSAVSNFINSLASPFLAAEYNPDYDDDEDESEAGKVTTWQMPTRGERRHRRAPLVASQASHPFANRHALTALPKFSSILTTEYRGLNGIGAPLLC